MSYGGKGYRAVNKKGPQTEDGFFMSFWFVSGKYFINQRTISNLRISYSCVCVCVICVGFFLYIANNP